jgi:hypothetical protein
MKPQALSAGHVHDALLKLTSGGGTDVGPLVGGIMHSDHGLLKRLAAREPGIRELSLQR